MKTFWKYIAIMTVAFMADFFSKMALLRFLMANHRIAERVNIYDIDKICATCDIEGIFVSWKYILGNDYGISNLFNIQFVWNRGISFSALNSVMPIILVCISAIIIGYLFYYLFWKACSYEKVPIAMIIGGALGNLIDRIRFGAVIDFIQWHIGGWWTFPAIFNIGDMFITFGVIIYLINLFINRKFCVCKK